MVVIDPYQKLANGIILQAARDYQTLLCGKDVRGASIGECRRFFNSEYFTTLTKIDGPTLMHQLEAEVKDYGYDYSAIKASHGEA